MRRALPQILVAGALLVGCGGDAATSPSPVPPGSEGPAGPPEEGKWYPARSQGELTTEQRTQIAALEALGYASGVEEAEDGSLAGILVHDPDAAQEGLNLFVSGHAPVALLMDMRGQTVHEWRYDEDEAFPTGEERVHRGFWRRARVEPNGDLLAIFENIGLLRLNAGSELLWTHAGLAHHDLDVTPDGEILLLERRAGVVPWIHAERPILDDLVTRLDAQGNVLEQVSLVECIERSPLRTQLENQLRGLVEAGLAREAKVLEERKAEFEADPSLRAKLDLVGDMFHTNTLQLLDGSLAHLSPHFAAGNVLVSIRNLHRVAILDPAERRLVWSLRGPWRSQHEPVLLADGKLLLFDNSGPRVRGERGFSEVLEVDPLSGEVLWSYKAQEKDGFNSPIAGSCQRLGNGNTLITESTAGRAFEVTPAGRVVWEFVSPYRAGPEGQFVAFLPDMQRLSADFPTDW